METLRLLVVEESLNTAEELASAIRNSGMAVRMTRIEDEQDLVAALQTQEWELILAPMQMAELSATRVLSLIEQCPHDIPLIIITKITDDEQAIIEVLDKGARDTVDTEAKARLQIIINRETKNLHSRRTLKKAMKALTDAERRCRTLIDSSRDAISYIHEGMHMYANTVYLDMFGYNELEEMEGMPIMDMIAADEQQKFKNFLKNYKTKSGQQKLQIKGKRIDDVCFNAVMEFTPATVDMEPCTQIIIRAQQDTQELESKLKHLSNQDLLTGLYNRQYITEETELATGSANSGGDPSYVLFIDLDGFSKVKELVGIAGNDVVLNDFSNILRVTTQKLNNAVLARYSDSVFMVLLNQGNPQLAEKLAEAIRCTMEDFIFDIEGQSLTMTCSIGIVVINDTLENAQAVITNADVASNIAKNNGGNQIHQHDAVSDAQAGEDRDQQIVGIIRQAVEKNLLRQVFQPVVSLHGECCEIYEVLLRMLDSDGDTVMPGQFLPAAENAGLMPTVDRWVVQNAIKILQEQRQQGSMTRFFIKLSASSFKDETFLPWVARKLSQARMKGDAITFEITEESAVSFLKHAKYFCKGVHEIHCKVALDHFGIGKNSFNCLKHLDVDYLKIDGSFVHNLANDKKNQALVKSINEMAHGMGKLTIAEFVQDATSLAMLWQFGVNYIQGNYLQKPYENLTYDFTNESEIV